MTGVVIIHIPDWLIVDCTQVRTFPLSVLRELILVELDNANVLRITVGSGRETDWRRPDNMSNDPVLRLRPLFAHIHEEPLELLDCRLCLPQLALGLQLECHP